MSLERLSARQRACAPRGLAVDSGAGVYIVYTAREICGAEHSSSRATPSGLTRFAAKRKPDPAYLTLHPKVGKLAGLSDPGCSQRHDRGPLQDCLCPPF